MARRKKQEEPVNHERWLVSYADFITLLFAFFVVLYATSQADVKKQEEFEESVRRSFASMTGVGAGAPFDELDQLKNNALIRAPIERFPPMGSASKEVQDYVEG